MLIYPGPCKLSFLILLYIPVCVISKIHSVRASSLTVESIETEKAVFERNRFLLRRFFQVPETFWIKQRLTDQHLYTLLNHSSPEMFSTTDPCARDIEYFVSNIEKMWAIKMMDSFGKLESGLLYGRLYWPGNYDECLNVSAPPGEKTTGFDGRYCFLTWLPKEQIPLAIQSSVCIPSSCSASKLQLYYNFTITYLEKLPFFKNIIEALNLVGIRCIPESVSWDKSAIICLCFIALLTGIVLIATAYDIYVQRKPLQIVINDSSLCSSLLPEEIDSSDPNFLNSNFQTSFKSPSGEARRALQCFSALKNGSAILDTSRTGQLDCLHGVRFLSMSWVILGHTYLMGLGQMSNIVSLLENMDSFAFLTILQGTFSVDSFFVLSGFLLAYLFLKDGPSHMGIRQWVGFYVHRYLRLTPTYALLLGVWASVWLYVGSGPFWLYDGSPDQINCQTKWWENLLYINNFANASTGCMTWGWYLANDMQFFVISPIFLVPLLRWPLVGCMITFILLLASWIATGVISYQNNFTFWDGELTNATFASIQELQFFDLIYDKPYTRIGPYLIGVLVAVSYLHYRKRQYMMSKWLVIFGWACATVVTLLTVYGIYHVHFGIVTTAFYNALSRSAFALGLGWLIFACLTEHGGPVNWILSWKMWIPLSRLTYCAYLLHPMIIMWYFGSLKDTFYFSHNTIIMMFFAMMVVSYGAAFISSLVVESPVISLEKYIRNRDR